jgi:hypothetical protein
MSVEFDCEGCGARVFAVGIDAVPRHGFCCVCEWLCEFVTDPESIQAIRERQNLIEGGNRANPNAR